MHRGGRGGGGGRTALPSAEARITLLIFSLGPPGTAQNTPSLQFFTHASFFKARSCLEMSQTNRRLAACDT